MAKHLTKLHHATMDVATGLLGPKLMLSVLPAATLCLYWLFGSHALVVIALAAPLAVLCASAARGAKTVTASSAMRTGLVQREHLQECIEGIWQKTTHSGLHSAVFNIEIDNFDEFVDVYGQSAAERVTRTLGDRLVSAMRSGDIVSQTGDWSFTLCMKPVQHLDLETCIQIAGRLQTAIEEPVSLDGTTVYVTACLGFAKHSPQSAKTDTLWRDAARMALREAQRYGPSAIRAYSTEMRERSSSRVQLRDEVAAALSNGQIRPWFQPQISTDTGALTGFEALARWDHPDKGLIPPAEFLDVIEQAGMLERLAEVMMFHAFTALKAWDKAGVSVPQVGVNFAGPELNNPNLVDKIRWELDRFNLAPDRLTVEVLETVVSNAPDDTVSRNLNLLGELGCGIDLDDFGTGHTSIASIRRFSVGRIKIDRSFVMKADRDPEQQRMISAILTMAERLNIETLAEGVETVGEHALLAQLGCGHVQGFGIARPMPFAQATEWLDRHNAKLSSTTRIIGNKLR